MTENKTFHTLLKWTATVLIAISVGGINFSPELAATSVLVFAPAMVGHIIWGTYAYIMREHALVWVNVAFIPMDAYAMYVRL